MNQNNQQFQAAAVAAKFKDTCVKLDNLLSQANHEELEAIRQKLRAELKSHREQGFFTVAFVGQYSAGKSTIISALTGRRDIHIDADIATDTTASYDWNGIKLIDTPGLFTDRPKHDEITYEAIDKADLLVFCLTYMLFDSVTVKNFKELAYDKGYRWKMMLVINKMSDEAGEEEQKIANYRQSLADPLHPYSLDEFPLCFIDAKDYCEGSDEDDEFLLEVSRFQTFINALNNFVKHRGYLAKKFDTPVRIALGCVDDAQSSLTRNSTQDSSCLEILNRISRKVRKERDRLRTQVQSIALRMSSEIVKEGTLLAATVGREDFEMLNKQADLNVQKHYEKAERELEAAVNAAAEEIRQDVKEELTSPLFKSFVASLEKFHAVSAKNVGNGMDVERIKAQVNWIKGIGEKAGVQLTTVATREIVSTAGDGFLRSIDVVGSGMHRSVLTVGKFVGFKFKPWQAVGIAKNLGNAAKFLGPALGIATVGVELLQIQQEHQREQQMADVRREITSQFQVIAKDLENQIQIQLWEFEAQTYGEIEQKILEARQQEESAIAASNTWVKQLAEIRKEFELILRYITKATENSVV